MKIRAISTMIFMMSFLAIILVPNLSFSQKKHKGHKGKRHPAKGANHRHKHSVKKNIAVRHYKNMPRRSVVMLAPKAAVIVTHKQIKYRYHNGVYYRPSGNKFVVVAAPRGRRVKVLPTKRYRFVHAKRTYYYYYGTFYSQVNESDEYEVVTPPLGAKIDLLPEGYEVVEYNNDVCYKLDKVYYRPVESEGGDVVYEVVKVDV